MIFIYGNGNKFITLLRRIEDNDVFQEYKYQLVAVGTRIPLDGWPFLLSAQRIERQWEWWTLELLRLQPLIEVLKFYGNSIVILW